MRLEVGGGGGGKCSHFLNGTYRSVVLAFAKTSKSITEQNLFKAAP